MHHGPASQLDTGGNVREPLHLRWTISAPVAEVLERLRPLSACHRGGRCDGDQIAMENGPDGEPHVMITWYERGPSGDAGDWRMIGFLHVDEGRLSADVPSRALADRAIGEISARLGAAATFVETRPSMPVCAHTRGCWIPVPLV